MHELTDEEIAKRVQDGDAEAFGLIIERYEPKIARYASKFLFDGDDRKDIVQEVFIKAYVNIRGFDASRRFSPWLYRIAHNEFIDAMSRKQRLPVFSFDLDTLFPNLASPETADGDAAKKEMRDMLDGSLAKIGAKYREPLVLYYFEDMEYKEIADVLRIPVSTVGVRLTRGKAMLKSYISKNG